MTALLTVAGGLLLSVLAVGAVLYVLLGRDVTFEWDSTTRPGEHEPEK